MLTSFRFRVRLSLLSIYYPSTTTERRRDKLLLAQAEICVAQILQNRRLGDGHLTPVVSHDSARADHQPRRSDAFFQLGRHHIAHRVAGGGLFVPCSAVTLHLLRLEKLEVLLALEELDVMLQVMTLLLHLLQRVHGRRLGSLALL